MNQPLLTVSSAAYAGPCMPVLLRDERLHDFAATAARRTPDGIALRCDGAAFTYAELDHRAEQLSEGLRAQGVGQGDIVGLWLCRSITLHVMILAILKAGATFLPFDVHAPPERVALCLDDCAATLLVTDRPGQASLPCPAVYPNALQGAALASPASRPPADQAAYIIYTSGSTGRPKGVAVSHRSICHLIRAENEVLGIVAQDVVYQGFSAAFDMALEEVFIAYLVGATLIVATQDQVLQIDRLPSFLTDAKVSVLHCVPTLLSMLDRDLPSVRLINVGGEACSEALVSQWARPGRRMVNTYGPTETTVTATSAELHPGEPVTIGSLLPNYTAVLLDEAGNSLIHGGPGELCIGGPGVSLGYLNRPELNADRFIALPTALSLEDPLFYRTGDSASIDPRGRFVLHGRLDNQVKHRGYRIDLGEIEAELCRLSGVRAAACVLRDAGPGEHLAAFVVHAGGPGADLAPLRAGLGKRLPCYMIPAIIHAIPDMPRLVSGKVDRKSLPAVPPPKPAFESPPGTPEQAPILTALRTLFPHATVEPGADFFRDLGGHSLLAATLVSQLRKQSRFTRLSLIDLYTHRTAEALAAQFPPSDAAETQEPTATRPAAAPLRHTLCSAAQFGTLPLILILAALEVLGPYLAFDWVHDRHGMVGGTLTALAVFIAIPPALSLVAIAAKWTLLGRVREGRHPLWGSMYFRWWLVSRLIALVNTSVLADTPLLALFHRALGARIGRRAHLGALTIGADDLLEIGSGATLGGNVTIGNARVEAGWLTFARVTIGTDAQIGAGCVLEGGCAVGACGELANLSLLQGGARVPAHQVWAGSPAVFRGPALLPGPREPVSRLQFLASAFGFAAVASLLLPTLYLLPMLPSLLALEQVQLAGLGRANLLIFAPVLGFAYVLLVLAEIVGLRWLILGRVREGTHGTASLFFLRKWTVDRLLDMSLVVLHPFYASLYVRPLFRALGAKVGRGAEISTAASVTHDLLEIGEGAFVADAVTLGDPEIRGGRLTLRRTVLGNRAFIGNSALLPDGVRIADNCLVGCLSVPPVDAPLATGQACFGSPAVLLPARQASTAWDVRLTFQPGRRQITERLTIEAARILLPRAAIFFLLCVALDTFETLSGRLGVWPALFTVPVLYCVLLCLPALFGTVALKWGLVGRYRIAEHPMWSRPVWLTEAVTAVYEGLTVPLLLRHLRGTPFLPASLRLFGARIGRRVWLDTTDLTEFDLVTIGEEAELSQHSGPQTHLFEDRVMKVGPVTLGARSTMGFNSIILPGGRLEQDAHLGALSLVMKGETIPAGSRWAGSPSRPCAGLCASPIG